jgi:predicted acetyltransferase
MAEFFVLRKYRRARVGMRTALLLFHQYPGVWEVPVAWYNQPALLFWRRATHRAAAGNVKECSGDGERWSGTVLRFKTQASPARTLPGLLAGRPVDLLSS